MFIFSNKRSNHFLKLYLLLLGYPLRDYLSLNIQKLRCKFNISHTDPSRGIKSKTLLNNSLNMRRYFATNVKLSSKNSFLDIKLTLNFISLSRFIIKRRFLVIKFINQNTKSPSINTIVILFSFDNFWS